LLEPVAWKAGTAGFEGAGRGNTPPLPAERWFAELTNRKLRRSTHRSVTELETDVQPWIQSWNENPKPFVWTKNADEILDSLAHYCHKLTALNSESEH
jgi:hypothetical protein